MKTLNCTVETSHGLQILVQDFQPFPRDGTASKASYDKTINLRAKEGLHQGKKIPPMSEYMEKSLIEEALKQTRK